MKCIDGIYFGTDDMEIAPDFFTYFEAAAELLDRDKYVQNSSSLGLNICPTWQF